MAAGLHGPDKDIWSISLYEDLAVINSFLGEEFRYSALTSGILSGVIAPLVSVANAIVIAAIWKDPYKQLRSSPSNIIIASMACCDFLVGVVCSSAQCYSYINSWIKGRITTNTMFISYAAGIFFVGLSLANVVVLTIDRVFAVTNPLLYKVRVTKSRLIKTLAFIWVFYVVLASALLYYPLRYYTYIYLTAIHALPSISVLISCSLSLLILYRVRRQTHELKVNQSINANTRKFMERNRKITKTILVIIMLLLACCCPAPLVALVSTTCSSCGVKGAKILMISYNFGVVLLHINSLVNPFLYAFRLPKFKKPVKLVIKCLVNCKGVQEYKLSNSMEIIADETPRIKRNEMAKTSLGSTSEDTKL